jgi:hypothetical protein
MKTDNIVKLKEKLIQFCVSKSISYTKEQVDIQASMMLHKFSLEDVSNALRELFYETPFFPDASQIAKKINGSSADNKALADLGASKLLEAGSKFSVYDKSGDIKNFLGPELFSIFERMGGLDRFARIQFSEIGTMRAQLRDMVSANIENGKIKQIDVVAGRAVIENDDLKRVDFTQLIE